MTKIQKLAADFDEILERFNEVAFAYIDEAHRLNSDHVRDQTERKYPQSHHTYERAPSFVKAAVAGHAPLAKILGIPVGRFGFKVSINHKG